MRSGPGEDQVLVAALELGPAEVGGLEVLGLEQRAHRAVEDEDPLGQRRPEARDALVAAHRFFPGEEEDPERRAGVLGVHLAVEVLEAGAAELRSRSAGWKPR